MRFAIVPIYDDLLYNENMLDPKRPKTHGPHLQHLYKIEFHLKQCKIYKNIIQIYKNLLVQNQEQLNTLKHHYHFLKHKGRS